MYKIGLSTNGKIISDELFNEYRKNNITEAEISQAGYDDFDYKAVKKSADANGVNLWSLHLPFAPFETIDISSCDKEKREGTIHILSEIIKKASDVGIDKFIIHPSAEPIEKDRACWIW